MVSAASRDWSQSSVFRSLSFTNRSPRHVCLPLRCPVNEGLEVTSGLSFCQIDENGCATDGADDHGNNEACAVRVNAAGTLTFAEFDIEPGGDDSDTSADSDRCPHDYIQIGGTRYCNGDGDRSTSPRHPGPILNTPRDNISRKLSFSHRTCKQLTRHVRESRYVFTARANTPTRDVEYFLDAGPRMDRQCGA